MSELTETLYRTSTQVQRPHHRLFDVVRLATVVRRAFKRPKGPRGAIPVGDHPDEHLDEDGEDELSDSRAVAANAPEEKSVPHGIPKLSRLSTMARNVALDAASQKLRFFTDTPTEQILSDLAVDPDSGLSSEEAEERLKRVGPNELAKEPPRSILALLLEQFEDLLVLMLVAAAIISISLGQYAAGCSIVVIITCNAILGVVQEAKAGKSLDALQSMSAPLAIVLRDGQQKSIASAEVVPGDILVLDTGKKIAADVRLIETHETQCNEMALTGEPEGVKKDADWLGSPDEDDAQEEEEDDEEEKKGETASKSNKKEKGEGGKKDEKALTERNMAYMGCAISDGRAKGVVVKTGMKTRMGEIAHLLATAQSGESPLQAKLHKLGVKLGMASLAVSMLVFVIGVSTERGTDPADPQPVWLQMLLVAVSLTVAAVPEGLPACVTICLAVGMRAMVKKNALIRNLHSVETLGSASVICTDKTGTLTKGEMTAVRLWLNPDAIFTFTGQGYGPEGDMVPLHVVDKKYAKYKDIIKAASDKAKTDGPHTVPLKVAVMCSNASLQYDEEKKAWDCVGNTSERPLVVAAAKVGLQKDDIDANFVRHHENPFSSARKMMSTLVELKNREQSGEYFGADTKWLAAVKGAPNYIMRKCTRWVSSEGIRELTDDDRAAVDKAIDGFSEQAFRVLAIAYQPFTDDECPSGEADSLEKDLILCGLVASIDPERKEVTPSIVQANEAGVRVVMITGDYVTTAKAIAENIGLLPRNSPQTKAVDCEKVRLISDKMAEIEASLAAATTEDEKHRLTEQLEVFTHRLDDLTAMADVYARAKPADKITIVRSLQRQGHVCSMTGDGVNDAPALRQANIGVAMGITGTDVAKGAADMILVDDDFRSIVAAVEEGRKTYANITKFVFFLLSTNVAEVWVILLATSMFGLQSPLTAVQILWLNLATDGAPAVALAMEGVEKGAMSEGPRKRSEALIGPLMIVGIVIQTVVIVLIVLSTYILGLSLRNDSWDGINSKLSADDQEHGFRVAQTMTILVITYCELLRAYTSRSLRESVFELGMFSNPWMQYAVGISVFATTFIANVPGVQDVFGMVHLNGREWAWVLCISVVPAIVDEITKYAYRETGFGLRPKVITSDPSVAADAMPPMGRTKSKEGFASLDDIEMKAEE